MRFQQLFLSCLEVKYPLELRESQGKKLGMERLIKERKKYGEKTRREEHRDNARLWHNSFHSRLAHSETRVRPSKLGYSCCTWYPVPREIGFSCAFPQFKLNVVQEKESHGIVKIGLTRRCFVRLLLRNDGWLQGD